VHGHERDGQALGGCHGRLPGSPDLLSGHRQHGVPGAPVVAEVGGGSANVRPCRFANRNSERSAMMAL
jgi:hypothetical protein